MRPPLRTCPAPRGRAVPAARPPGIPSPARLTHLSLGGAERRRRWHAERMFDCRSRRGGVAWPLIEDRPRGHPPARPAATGAVARTREAHTAVGRRSGPLARRATGKREPGRSIYGPIRLAGGAK